MKKWVPKLLSFVCLSFLLLFTLFLGQVPLIEGKHLFDPYIDTKFGENYSPEKFDKIKIGMAINNVIKVIGEPINKGPGYADTLNTNFYYTGDGRLLHLIEDNIQKGYDDFAWYSSTLEVNRSNRIIQIYKGWIYD